MITLYSSLTFSARSIWGVWMTSDALWLALKCFIWQLFPFDHREILHLIKWNQHSGGGDVWRDTDLISIQKVQGWLLYWYKQNFISAFELWLHIYHVTTTVITTWIFPCKWGPYLVELGTCVILKQSQAFAVQPPIVSFSLRTFL